MCTLSRKCDFSIAHHLLSKNNDYIKVISFSIICYFFTNGECICLLALVAIQHILHILNI